MCDICPPGSYQNATGKLNCIECPVGTYSEMTGAKSLSDCKLAPAGNFAEGTGNDGFTPCLAGTYQDKPGQGACKVSTAGVLVGSTRWQWHSSLSQTTGMLAQRPLHCCPPSTLAFPLPYL